MSGAVKVSWPSVNVEPWVSTEDVAWEDGKPRCGRHRFVCLVPRESIGVKVSGTHVCAACMREWYEATGVVEGRAERRERNEP